MPSLEARDLPLKRFTADDVRRLPLDAIELVDGYIVSVPQPTERAAALRMAIAVRLGEAGFGQVAEKRALDAGTWDRPEVDILVVHGAVARLIVDVADDGKPAPGPVRDVAYKRARIPAYARAGVPEVWLVDVANRRLELYKRPNGRSYVEVSILDDRDTLDVNGTSWPVKSLFP